MKYDFIGKLMNDNKFLGSVFLIRKNIALSAVHNVRNVDLNNCNMSIDFRLNGNVINCKVDKVKKISELDLLQITLKEEVSECSILEISIEDVNDSDNLVTYGYPNNESVTIKLEYYEPLYDEAADHNLMVKHEEDEAKWNGISGAPLICDETINGIVIKNNGGDGLKTRLKAVSFNKIINYLVNNNIDDVLENIPQKFMSSKLYERMVNNGNLCDELYIFQQCSIKGISENINLHFLRVNDKNKIDICNYRNKIQESIVSYSLMLDDICGKYEENFMAMVNRANKINEKILKVKARMNIRENIGLLILWMLSEGILSVPRIGNFLITNEGELYEEDLYFRRNDSDAILMIPFVSIYEELFESIKNILDSINKSVSNEEEWIDYSSIEWDGQAVSCLDYKSQMIINKILTKTYKDKINVEITSLIIYGTDMYDYIPPEASNDSRISKFLKEKFINELKRDEEKYLNIIQQYTFINDINLNLFVIPFSAISDVDTICEESR